MGRKEEMSEPHWNPRTAILIALAAAAAAFAGGLASKTPFRGVE